MDPSPPAWYFEGFARASLFAGRCEEAIACYRECLRHIPESLGCNIDLMVSYMAAGREEEGKARAQEVLRLNPNFSLSTYGSAAASNDFTDEVLKANASPDPHAGQCVVDRVRRSMFMLKAGIPE